jgi:hypothetical protein
MNLKQVVVAQLSRYLSICLERLRTSVETISQDIYCLGWDLNWPLPEFESKVLPLGQTFCIVPSDFRFPAPSRQMRVTGDVWHGQHVFFTYIQESCLHTFCFWWLLVFWPKPLPELVHILWVKYCCHYPQSESLVSSVNISAVHRQDDTGSIPGMARFFSSHHRIQTSSGAHTASYGIWIWGG